LRAFSQEWRPDVLDAHFIWPDGVGVSLLARELGWPYVITLRGKIYPCLEIPSQRQQCAQALRGAAAVISVDDRMARLACELGAGEDRVQVIPNGVDLDRFYPRDKETARRELGLPVEGRLMVSVAHLGRRKGHFETIQALAALPSDVRLVLVGGDAPEGRDARALQRFAHSLGVADRMILAGRQPYERIPLYFAAADISVLASWREGCPNVVLESLASGRPVVASDVGSVSAMIQDCQNGRIVPPQDARSLAKAIDELMNALPPPEQVRGSPAVRSWDQIAEDVCHVLRQAVGEDGLQRSRDASTCLTEKAPCK
jgi:glycosyltransferase involved in cell wall biosynthesis